MQLDQYQKDAVETDSKQVLVLAGPGSGKTRCIVERAAHLMEHEKVSAYDILLLTFSRKAAQEMRTRVEARLGKKGVPMTILTIHAFALRFLKQFGEFIGMKPSHLTVYSEFEEKYLMREVGLDMNFYDGKKKWEPLKKEIDAVFNKYYQDGEDPDALHPVYKLFQEFLSRCRENNSFCYGTLLTSLRDILQIPDIKQYVHWKHIILDEGHDTDRLQWQLIRRLQELGDASLFVVADENQAIYSFRGAYPEYLIEHKDEFKIYYLLNNYRSCIGIVRSANNLIEHNRNRIPRTMIGVREEIGEVFQMAEMDSEKVASMLVDLKSDGRNQSDIVVLARNHIFLKKVSEVLTNLNFPHTRIGQTDDLMDRMDFRVFHAFLKLIQNPFDSFSFSLIRDLLGVSRKQYQEIRLQATKESRSHFHVWWKSLSAKDSALEFFGKSTTDDSPILLAERIQATWPFDSPEIMGFVEQWMDEQGEGTLEDYLDWLATYDLQDEIKEIDDKLKLMTVHAAKGLEFSTVMIIGCNDGILPSKQSIEAGDSEIEHERSLFYVGITRAKDSLILAVRPELTQAESEKYFENPVSRFLGEI